MCETDAGVVIMLSPSLRPAHLANGIGCSHCSVWGQHTHTLEGEGRKERWMEDEEMEVGLLLSVELFDGKAISVKTWEGWRWRTMERGLGQ